MKKRLFILIMALAIVISVNPISIAADETDTISISSAEELQKIGTDDGYPLDGNYVLTGNIQLSGEWNSIGGTDEGQGFSGTFDGDGYTISGLTAVLFAGLGDGATVKDLTLDVTIDEEAGTDAAALALVSYDITVSGVTVQGSVSGGGSGGCAGFIVRACGDTVMEDCVNEASIEGKDRKAAGFISSTGTGDAATVTISNCVNNGTVTAYQTENVNETAYEVYAAGFIAWNGRSGLEVTIEDCVNNAAITGTRTRHAEDSSTVAVGGIIGTCWSGSPETTLVNVTNNGAVTAENQAEGHNVHAGGIVGMCNPSAVTTFENVVSNGSVTGRITNGSNTSGVANVGGIVGQQNGATVYILSATITDNAVLTGTSNAGDGMDNIGAVVGNRANDDTHIYIASVDASNGTLKLVGSAEDENSGYTTIEARIGDTYYETLEEAIDEADDGDTVTLLKDVEISGGSGNTTGILTITEDITLDGGTGNYSITAVGTITDGSSMINIQDGANVTIKDLTIDSNDLAKHGLNIYNATVVVENVTIQDGTGYGVVCNSSDVTLTNLTTSGNAWGGVNVDSKVEGGESDVTMTACTIGEEASVVIENAEDETITTESASGSYNNVLLQNVTDNVTLIITGGSFDDVLEVTKEDGEDPVEVTETSDMITISGGTFGNDVTAYLAEGLVQNSDGTVSTPYSPPVTTDPRYTITVEDADNGTVTVSPTSAREGAEVTITVTPDEGYELAELTVTDSQGGNVEVTDNGDGTYSFTMPDSRVTIEAAFVETGEEETDEPWVNTFVDVDTDDWYYDYVEYVCANGLMVGTSDVTFEPTGTVTRGTLMTILARLDGVDTTDSDPWYQAGMEWAVAAGVSDGTDPEGTITREQVATMLWRYDGQLAVAENYLAEFDDADEIHDWAAQAMNWAVSVGVITGGDNGLDPQGTATRAELAAMLTRFCENVL